MKNLEPRGINGANSSNQGVPNTNKISILQKPVRASQNLPPKIDPMGNYSQNQNSNSMPLSPSLDDKQSNSRLPNNNLGARASNRSSTNTKTGDALERQI